LDQDEIIEILDQAKAMDPEWHEVMVIAKIDIFEMSYEEFVSSFKRLENLEKIRRTNCPSAVSLPVFIIKPVSVTSIVDKFSKNPKAFSMWCHYCDKNNDNTADCRVFSKFKQQKLGHVLKPNLDPGRFLRIQTLRHLLFFKLMPEYLEYILKKEVSRYKLNRNPTEDSKGSILLN
jgi:hypothetical protein